MRRLASSDTNEPRRFLHLAWGWRGWREDLGNGRLGGRRGLIIGKHLAIARVRRRQWESGVTNHMEVPSVAGLSVTGSFPTSDSE